MAAFNSVVTNMGNELLLQKIAANQDLLITAVKIGIGTPHADPLSATALVEEYPNINIVISDKRFVAASTEEDSHMIVTAEILNDLLSAEVAVTEIALYAGAVLFSYSWYEGATTDNVVPPPAEPGKTDSIHIYDLRLFLSNKEYESVKVNYSITVKDSEKLEEVADAIGSDTDAPNKDGKTIFSVLKWVANWLSDNLNTFITNTNVNIGKVLTYIGLPNPTEAGRSDIFKYLRLLEFQPKLTNMVQFLKDGTFTVPEGVNTIYITACGGGGGGFVNGASTIATAGTATIIGNLVTLLGGGAGMERYGGAAGGSGGGKGGYGTDEGQAGIGGGGGRLAGGGGSLGGGGGGNSSYTSIPGGNSIYSPGFSAGIAGSVQAYYGGNGSLGGGGGSRNYGGGGGGDAIIKKAFNVTPGATIAITVGKGGVGSIMFSGSTYSVGGYGGEGIVIIEW